MCPVCWTTALAVFATFASISAVAIVGTDRCAQVLAGIVLSLAVLHKGGWLVTQWWAIALPLSALAVRGYCLMRRAPQQQLFTRIWQRGMQVAATHCPSRKGKH